MTTVTVKRIPELCVAILAGGQSRRMGFNKALIEISGRPLIQKLVERAQALSDEVVICSENSGSYGFLRVPVIGDLFPDHGPLAGLHSAFRHTHRSLVLLVACDLPNVDEGLWQNLVSLADGYDAVIPRTSDGGIHPLCAVYRSTCLPFLEKNLSWNINKITDLFLDSPLAVKWLEGTEGRFHDSAFDNLNTPDDLARFVIPSDFKKPK